MIETSAVTHVTFATPQFTVAVDALRVTARLAGISDLRIYRPDHPAVRTAASENPEVAQYPRGAGYWIWKPYVVLDALTTLPEGSVVLYTDVAMTYVDEPSGLLARSEDAEIVLFNSALANATHRTWTKRDCLVLLDADNEQHWDRRLAQGGVQLYRVGPSARSFVAEWRDAMRDPRVLTDAPNELGYPNLDEFVEHRHDMSVLSVIAARHEIDQTRSPTVDPRPDEPGSYPRIFWTHRKRDPGLPRDTPLA